MYLTGVQARILFQRKSQEHMNGNQILNIFKTREFLSFHENTMRVFKRIVFFMTYFVLIFHVLPVSHYPSVSAAC